MIYVEIKILVFVNQKQSAATSSKIANIKADFSRILMHVFVKNFCIE